MKKAAHIPEDDTWKGAIITILSFFEYKKKGCKVSHFCIKKNPPPQNAGIVTN